MKKRRLRVASLFLCLLMLLTSADFSIPAGAEETVDAISTESRFEGDGFHVIFALQDLWDNGFNATVKIENTSDTTIENWMLGFDYQGEIANIWNAVLDHPEAAEYTAKNVGWNQDIEAGKSVEFGISGREPFAGFPAQYRLIGDVTSDRQETYQTEYLLHNDWGSGFSAEIKVTNFGEAEIEDWILEFDFDRDIGSIWNAVIVSHEGNHYVVKNAGYNANIRTGGSMSFGFNGESGTREEIPENYSLKSYHAYCGDSMELDTDEDGIPDGLETLFGLDYKKADTDEDGLTDYEELYILGTNPLKKDSDDNGVMDSDEDLDRDGVTNKMEFLYGTDPANADTDRDGLTDYEELFVYLSDPLDPDTDKDGLNDYDDVTLGFSPLLRDTDENGIPDPDEKVMQRKEEAFDPEDGRGVTKVSVSMNVNGNIEKSVEIFNMYEFDSLSRDVVGLVGIPVEIHSETGFETATIEFTYDKDALGNVKEEDLAVLWFDEANCWYQILDQESVINTDRCTVSIETTHFSTYMLVDRTAWYEAWRDNIDYRVSQEGDTDKHYFDITFVVDVSGSMKGARIEAAKQALWNFVDALTTGDRAALVVFNSEAATKSGLTDDLSGMKEKINALAAGGNTNVNNGLTEALNVYRDSDGDREKVVVLICDGDVNYIQATINKYKDQNIKIYTVNVQYDASHTSLQKMADQTGGQYYYGSSTSDFFNKMVTIQDSTIDKIDTTDTDKDGLYDIYEVAGMRMPNGTIVYTDPANRDTDEDGMTDYEETGLVYNIDNRYIGNRMYKNVKYFRMRSNPAEKDTDSDGIGDKQDKFPWMADLVEIDISGNFPQCQYLNIVADDGSRTDAGNQGWWRSNAGEKGNWYQYLTNISNRIAYNGCGLIAMSDLELYFTQQKYKSNPPELTPAISYDSTTGVIDRKAYMEYVEYNSNHRYDLKGWEFPVLNFHNSLDNILEYSTLQMKTGVLPIDMESGLSGHLYALGSANTDIEWAPYMLSAFEGKRVLTKIEKMLKNDLPVVFSYHTFSEKKEDRLTLYYNLENAKIKNRDEQQDTGSHYMTVIGLCKVFRDDGSGYDDILKITSWGDIYYVRYDEYRNHLSYFTNILSIGSN